MIVEALKAAREALAWREQFEPREGEDSNDRFERIADIFYRETGYLRPGKDCALYSPEERQDVWDTWMAEGRKYVRSALAQADAALAAPSAEPVAYRLDWPPAAGVGLPRFFGADDRSRMQNTLSAWAGPLQPNVVPLCLATPAQPPADYSNEWLLNKARQSKELLDAVPAPLQETFVQASATLPAEPVSLSKQYAREQLAKQMAPVYKAFEDERPVLQGELHLLRQCIDQMSAAQYVAEFSR